MAERNYVFAIKFAVERDVIVKAECLTDAMEKLYEVCPSTLAVLSSRRSFHTSAASHLVPQLLQFHWYQFSGSFMVFVAP